MQDIIPNNGFLGQKRLQQRVAELPGYDTVPAGQIRLAA
jgi:putative molybdopterin biosynthesis protein